MVYKSIYVLLTRVAGTILMYILILLIAREWGKEGVGFYDLVMKMIFLVGSIVLMGGNQTMLQYSGKLKSISQIQSMKQLYTKLLSVSIVLSFFGGVALYFYADWIAITFFNKPDLEPYIKHLWIVFPLYSFSQINLDSLRALNRIKVSEFFRYVGRPAIALIGLLILMNVSVAISLDYLYLLIVVSFSVLFVGSFLFVLYSFKWREKISYSVSYSSIIRIGLPLMFSSILFLFLSIIDTFMLASMSTIEDVGLYSIALKVILPISFVLSSVNQVIAPKISELFFSERRKELIRILNQASRFIFWFSMPVIIIIALCSNVILNLFGEGFLESKTTLYILLVGQLVNAICGPVGNYMSMTGNQKMHSLFLLFSILLNGMLNFYLIPLYGINGAAMATTVSLILWNILGVVYIYRKHGISVFYRFI